MSKPTHIFDTSDDKRTRCGIKKADDACLPYVLAKFVQAHIDGRARKGITFPLCPECRKGGWPGRKRVIQRS